MHKAGDYKWIVWWISLIPDSSVAKKFDFTFEFTADLNRRSIDDAFFVELPFTTKIAYLDTMPAL